MDAVSYSYADKQAKRIKKFIENPDSTSGIMTQPSVIQAGETVTIPAGRTAIMANTVIDGTITLDGTMFIPSGAVSTGLVEKVTSTDNAIVRFNGTTGAIQDSLVTVDDNGIIRTQGVISTSPLYGIGYGAGSGGTVTQLTSKATTVTLNKPTGQIVMNNGELAANTGIQFALVNSLLVRGDIVSINIVDGIASTGNYRLTWSVINSTCYIYIFNTYGRSLSESVVLTYSIIKGATA